MAGFIPSTCKAYLAVHQDGEAGAEFQKILDHRGIVLNSPIGAFAHLQLARAYAMQGDSAKAKAAYQAPLHLIPFRLSSPPLHNYCRVCVIRIRRS